MMPDAVLNKASGVATSAAAQKGAGIEGQMQQEEVGAAFEMPSQMPRELQSWAWDK